MKKFLLWPPVCFLRQGLTLFFDCRLTLAAAGFAYFVLLTFFPVLICVSSLLGMANIDVAAVITQFEPFLPEITLDATDEGRRLYEAIGYRASDECMYLDIGR